jgi:hypothetical protein
MQSKNYLSHASYGFRKVKKITHPGSGSWDKKAPDPVSRIRNTAYAAAMQAFKIPFNDLIFSKICH